MTIGINWDTGYGSRKFKVIPKEGKDEHFRKTIRSFDKNVIIKSCDTYFVIETKVDENEIRNFTSVKFIKEISNEEFG